LVERLRLGVSRHASTVRPDHFHPGRGGRTRLPRESRSPARPRLTSLGRGDVANLMEQLAEERPDLNDDLEELRQAVGLKQHEGTGPPRR
jgi:hypothetical protein